MTTLDARYEHPPTVSADAVLPAPSALAASRRRELADFLRSRRERINPAQVGLPPGGRRRTPGLRREEVAQLSGLGLTWYTWLEQGRDIKVSPQVLEAVARTLQMDRHERSHLFTLADAPATVPAQECESLRPEYVAILTQLDPYPACIINARYDLLAWNSAYTTVSGDMATLPVDERNSLWLAFASPQRKALLVDFGEGVSRMVALYRSAMADHVGEPAWTCLVQRLEAISPHFRELWHRHDVAAPENLAKRLRHPELGLLTFTYTNLWLNPQMGIRMMAYTPLDEATKDALTRLDTVSPPPV